MRITTEILVNIAHDYVKKQLTSGEDLIAAYLTGSILSNNFLIGGKTDIDIILIKDIEFETRETIKLSHDIHLDVVNHPKKFYQPPKLVRTHPFLGSAINSCLTLYDDNHFIDFTQAGVRSGFDSYENRFERSFPLLTEARKNWLSLEMKDEIEILIDTKLYFSCLKSLSQAFAINNNHPISIRNFVPHLRRISEEVSFPALPIGLIGLSGGNLLDKKLLKVWIIEWKQFFIQVSKEPEVPAQFQLAKIDYYHSAIDELIKTESPMDGLWILINTWMEAQITFPNITSNLLPNLEIMGFSNESFPQKLKGLDALLDLIEEWFEN